MARIQVFIQGEGVREIRVLDLPADATVRDLVAAAAADGFAAAGDGKVEAFVEDTDDALAPGMTLAAAGIGNQSSVHVHRCKRVAITVHFNGEKNSQAFGPGATVHRVKQWAVGKKAFDLTPVDAAEHVLQVTGGTERPDEDVHIGTLVATPSCALAFDLVAKVRVEGRP
jgi:hypothetical protein